ncbi:CHRD domain-containing protein [Novosphingobium marinum]|uniref:CHRD domain-containing protein n=1 Tax=Novosphingobium marinum TaxID=1514948 RepID=A0A7Y9XVI7_9SPHN|nr:CHRD domain-containing protein [Novosphingobium marinum]NYH95369.1 hypothetical protein [Novosphingobium marinum]GGC26508.1 CHRD domain-containing protein [Novosphingobium marinum]
MKIPWKVLALGVLTGSIASQGSATTSSTARIGALLAGVYEPRGGDSDGGGSLLMEVDAETGRICYTLTARRIALTNSASLHQGEQWKRGPAVLALDVTGPDGDVCTAADPDLVRRMIAQPESYYVNISNWQFPDGALRGQLEAK